MRSRVIVLGADLDPAATPGPVEGGNEFYSVAGAFALRGVLPRFERGKPKAGVFAEGAARDARLRGGTRCDAGGVRTSPHQSGLGAGGTR